MKPWLPKAEPHLPPDGSDDEQVIQAIRAFEAGIANAAQQQLAWRYLMYVSGASEDFADLSYRPLSKGGAAATNFAEGKRFVGLMLRKLLRPEYTPKPQAQPAPPTIQKRMRDRAGKRAA